MKNNDGKSSLMVANQNGHTETFLLLLQHGACINMQDKNGMPSLMLTNRLAWSQKSIACGADINFKLQNKTTGINYIRGNTDIAFNCGSEINIDSLFLACLHNQILLVKRLLDSKDIFDDHINGYTPLMAASSCGHVEIVQLLLGAGARVNFSNFSDYPSLHLPIYQQMQIPGSDGQLSSVRGSALDMAVIRGRVEVVSLLLQYGAKVHNIYYLLRSITLKQAQANAKSVNSDETHWEKYRSILQILFSHDSNLIGRVQCTNLTLAPPTRDRTPIAPPT